MRTVTLRLFQLFLSIFIIYAMLYYFPNGFLLVRLYHDLILSFHQSLLVSLLCLVCIFLIEKRKPSQNKIDFLGSLTMDVPFQILNGGVPPGEKMHAQTITGVTGSTILV